MSRPKLYAILAVIALFLLMGLYTRELNFLFNTLELRSLVIVSILAGLAVAASCLWLARDRFTPVERHMPEILLIFGFSILFAPLIGSLLNRAFSLKEYRSFEFVSEEPYFASGYGFLKGEKIEPTGYYLMVREKGQTYRFKYQQQAYFPMTQPGAPVLLPLRRGFFGARVMLLK